MTRPTQAKLNLQALRENAALARQLAGAARLMAVVKADAYGHGAVAISTALEPLVDALAVACLEEALELRSAGIEIPILLLEGVFQPAELQEAAQHQLWLTIASQEQLTWLEEAKLDSALGCWLKVNTGMNRLGVSTASAAALYARIANCRNALSEPVLYTHLACADDERNHWSARQLAEFDALPISAPRSAANSAALIALPESLYDWVRPGYMLYGNSPLDETNAITELLRPVMTFSSRVIAVRSVEVGQPVGYGGTFVATRPSRIATAAVGYGDGYPRHAPNGTPVLVSGRRAPIAGRVSMDLITVDVTDIPEAEVGSEVILWGDGLSVDEVARHNGTLGYELTTRMPARAPRVIATP